MRNLFVQLYEPLYDWLDQAIVEISLPVEWLPQSFDSEVGESYGYVS